MARTKVKRKPKKLLIFIIIFVILIVLGAFVYIKFFNKNDIEEARVVSKIDNYGYTLKSNKNSDYKKLFSKLQKILDEKHVDEKEYAKIITEMFIVDFYSLGNHVSKTDVGGTDFIHPNILDNFIVNAEDTIYKYVESNIYGQRKQELPIVEKVSIESVTQDKFSYDKNIDEEAFIVKASWEYKDSNIADGYQDSATFIYVHDSNKLQLVEISNDESNE